MQRMWLMLWLLMAAGATAAAQDDRRPYAGTLAGVSTLSGDARAVTSPPDATLSMYKPENGLALDLFAGVHLARFFSVQANYIWNRNDLALVSSFVTPRGGGFYEQERHSAQHAIVADTLVYFRRRGSAIRPYLGTGLAIVRFTSGQPRRTVMVDLSAPAGAFSATKVALRSHVGIDFKVSDCLAFRYSFSETISGNPISPHLTPPGTRGLANFQNLFGLVAQF